MNALPGAAITFKLRGCEDTRIFLNLFMETSVCLFSGDKQCVTAVVHPAGMFHT